MRAWALALLGSPLFACAGASEPAVAQADPIATESAIADADAGADFEPVAEPAPPKPPPDTGEAGAPNDGGDDPGEGLEVAAPSPGPGEPLGIKACDEYLAKIQSCMTSLPPEAREAMEPALAETRRAWKEVVDTVGREALIEACETALDAIAGNLACAP